MLGVKTFLLILAALGFVTFGVVLFYQGLKNSPIDIFAIGLGLISALFFGAAIPLGIKRLFNTVIELELTKDYLRVRPDSNQGFNIPWNQILEFKEVRIRGAKIILIFVTNPDRWINRELNPIKKKLMQFSYDNYGTPFNITASGMNVSHKKLFQKLNIYKASL